MQDGINCEELWNINNGITLCEKCHKKKHTSVFSNFKDLSFLHEQNNEGVKASRSPSGDTK